jgi:hypothetical protein
MALKKLTLLVAMLAMILVAAAPAMAQDDDVIDDDSITRIQVGDNITVGDVNTQFSQNSVGDINVSATQVSGDNTAVGDGNVQVIAQDQDVSVSVWQSSFQFLNTGWIVFVH